MVPIMSKYLVSYRTLGMWFDSPSAIRSHLAMAARRGVSMLDVHIDVQSADGSLTPISLNALPTEKDILK